MKFIRRNQVQKITVLSRSSIYAMVADGTFPKQIKIGRRAVAWLETEIDVWMLSRVNSGQGVTKDKSYGYRYSGLLSKQ